MMASYNTRGDVLALFTEYDSTSHTAHCTSFCGALTLLPTFEIRRTELWKKKNHSSYPTKFRNRKDNS